jgi:protein-L-isoaspartate(D-aspartate) O-methyltransferase
MDAYTAQRREMVESQLRRRGIVDERTLAAMGSIPRERFVPHDLRHLAYTDRALPIAEGQTISQPYIVGLMTQTLQLDGHETVLEIGTGSGYQAAVLSQLARRVVTIERHTSLATTAMLHLSQVGVDNVLVVADDGTLGWPDEAPYERIIVTARAEAPPPALVEQLAPHGLLVMPVGDAAEQMLQAFRKTESGALMVEDLCAVRFVDLVAGQTD